MKHHLSGRLIICWLALWLCSMAAHADAAAWEADMAAARRVATLGYSMVSGDWMTAARRYKAAVKEAKKFPSPDPRLAESLYALGLCYLHPSFDVQEVMAHSENYEHRGERCTIRAAAICRKAYGKDDPRLAKTECMLGHLATHREASENQQTPEQHYRRALALVKKVGPQELPMVVEVYDLAVDYFLGEHDTRQAEVLMRQALAATEQVYGKNDPRTNNRLYCLAQIGAVAAGEALYRRALQNAELAFGTDDPRTEEARCQLSFYLAAHKQQSEACSCLLKVLANAEKAYGEDSPRLLPTLFHIVQVCTDPANGHDPMFERGIWTNPVELPSTKIESCLQRATHIAEKAGDGPARMETWSHLAAYYQVNGRQEDAWRPLEQALAAAEQAYGHDDARLLAPLYALAGWASSQDPWQVDPLYQRAVAITEHAYGASLPGIENLERIATAYEHAGRTEQAQALHGAIGELLMKNSDADPDDVMAELRRQATAAPPMADAGTATPSEARLLGYLAKINGPDSPEVVEELHNEIRHYSMSSPKQPLRLNYYLHRFAEVCPKAYAGKPTDLIVAWQELGTCYLQQSRYPEAIAAYTHGLTIVEHLPKPSTEAKYELAQAIGSTYRQQREYANAEKYLLQALKLAEIIEGQYSKRETESSGRTRLELVDQVLQELAGLYQETKNYPREDAIYARQYARSVKQNGKTWEGTVRLLLPRIELARTTGRTADAESLLRRALTDAENDPQIPHVGNWAGSYVGTIIMLQALTYRQMGKTAEAEACEARLFAMASEEDGRGISALIELAQRQRAAHADALSAGLLERLLVIEEKHYGKDSTIIEQTLDELGRTYAALSAPDKADACYTRLLAIEEKLDGGTGPRSPRSDWIPRVAEYFQSRQRLEEVESLWRRRLQRDKVRYGDQADACNPTILCLCNILVTRHKFAEAESLLMPVVTTMQMHAKAHNMPESLDINLAAGKLYLTQGKNVVSEPFLREAYTEAIRQYTESYSAQYLLPYAEAYSTVLHALGHDTDAKAVDERIAKLKAVPQADIPRKKAGKRIRN